MMEIRGSLILWPRGVALFGGFVGRCGSADRRFVRGNAGVRHGEWLCSAQTAERQGGEWKQHLILAQMQFPPIAPFGSLQKFLRAPVVGRVSIPFFVKD
jgi:hypothetical protein